MRGVPLTKDASVSPTPGVSTYPEGQFGRARRLRGLYYHPITQVIILALVCSLCPGMFNALTGLGGGGQVNATISANATCTLYATYAFFAFFSGNSMIFTITVNNKIGSKWTLFLGTLGYALYVGSYLAIDVYPNSGSFVEAAGAVLGITAAFLWTAQGSLMLSYATEAQKGVFISIFWAIFNLGAVVGASVSFGQNFHRMTNSVSSGTYVGFLMLTLVGVIIPFFMADPSKMVRTDGTEVVTPRSPSWKSEFHNLWLVILSDPTVLLLFPMFFASNYFFTWQFNDYNSALFNIRARSLNNLMYWISQIIGSVMMGLILDSPHVRLRRRNRAYAGWTVLLSVTFVVHIWAYEYQRGYTRQSIPPNAQKMDIYDRAYLAHVCLMVLYGLLDSMWQTKAFWLIGAMSNDTNKLAIYSGFYHSIQSAGAAGVWRMDAVGLPYMSIFLSTWLLVTVGLVCAFPMIYLRVRDTTVLNDEAILKYELKNVREKGNDERKLIASEERKDGYTA